MMVAKMLIIGNNRKASLTIILPISQVEPKFPTRNLWKKIPWTSIFFAVLSDFIVTKKVPNPHGSRGGPAHRGTIDRRVQELKDQGYEHRNGGNLKEELIRTPGGCKSCRRPDITTHAPDGST